MQLYFCHKKFLFFPYFPVRSADFLLFSMGYRTFMQNPYDIPVFFNFLGFLS